MSLLVCFDVPSTELPNRACRGELMRFTWVSEYMKLYVRIQNLRTFWHVHHMWNMVPSIPHHLKHCREDSRT